MGWDDQMKGIQTIDNSRTFWRQMKRMRWDDQMRGLIKQLTTYELETNEEVEIGSWDGRYPLANTKFTYSLEMDEDGTGWSDEGYLNNLIKFSYKLETDEEHGRGWYGERYSNIWPKFTYSLETMGQDDQIRIQTIWPSLHTSWRWIKRMDWDDKARYSNSWPKFTYSLETDEDDQIRGIQTIWPGSRTSWRRIRRLNWEGQRRGIQSINQVHIQTGGGWRGWHGMISGPGRYSNKWPSLHTSWKPMKRMGWDDQMRSLKKQLI